MALLEELVEEVLLRLPPADPVSLVRAALVCKPWCRLVSGRRFRRRFREIHGSPPMLGFICNLVEDAGGRNLYDISRFVPTSTFRPRRADHREWHAREARHGLVLLVSASPKALSDLAVWDPITDEWWELPPVPHIHDPFGWNAAVLSADNHHLDDCHGRPFLVVCLYRSLDRQISLRIYSSESGSWSEPAKIAAASRHCVDSQPALVGNALYFAMGDSILMYDVATQETSMIPLPPFAESESEYDVHLDVLMAMEDGGMAVATAEGTTITLWSMEISPNNRDIGWAQIRVIELDKLLRVSAASIVSNWVGFAAAGTSVFFIDAGKEGLFTLDIKSDQVKMVLKGKCILRVVPYMTFCTPALGSVIIDEGPELDASIAHDMKTQDAGAGPSNPRRKCVTGGNKTLLSSFSGTGQ